MQSSNYYASFWITDGTKRYFVPINLNVFIVYDTLENKTLAYVIEKENFLQENLYSSAIKYNNKIYFIPLHAKHFLCVDLESYKMQYIDIPICKGIHPKYALFSGGYMVKKYIYAIGYLYPGIVEINLETNEARVKAEWREKIGSKSASYSFTTGDKVIITPVFKTNLLLKYSLETAEIEIIKLEDIFDFKFDCICGKENNYWIVDSENKCIVNWNADTNVVEKIESDVISNLFEKNWYRYVLFYDEKIFLASGEMGPVIVFDPQKKKIFPIWKDKAEKSGFSPLDTCIENGKMIISDKIGSTIYQIDCRSYETEELKMDMDKEAIMRVIAKKKGIIIQEGCLELSDLIKYLINK